MKFTINSDMLAEALAPMAKLTPSKTLNQMLSNTLACVSDDILTLTTTNEADTLITRLKVEKSQNGSATFPTKVVNELLKTLSGQPLNCESDTETVRFTWLSGKSSFPNFTPDEFPAIPECEGTTVTLDTADFEKILSTVTPSVCTDELRPVLGCIILKITKDGIEAAGSDSKEIVIVKKAGNKSPESAEVLLPGNLSNIFRNLPEKEKTVSLTFNGKNAKLIIGNTTLLMRLVEGAYPAYNSIIPKTFKTFVTLDREGLISVLKRVSVCSDKAYPTVIFTIKGGGLTVKAQDLSSGTSSHETAACENIEGEDMELAFSSGKMVSLLGRLPGEKVSIKLSEPAKPVLIIPFGEESGQVTEILMPMRIQG